MFYSLAYMITICYPLHIQYVIYEENHTTYDYSKNSTARALKSANIFKKHIMEKFKKLRQKGQIKMYGKNRHNKKGHLFGDSKRKIEFSCSA